MHSVTVRVGYVPNTHAATLLQQQHCQTGTSVGYLGMTYFVDTDGRAVIVHTKNIGGTGIAHLIPIISGVEVQEMSLVSLTKSTSASPPGQAIHRGLTLIPL